MKKLLPLFLFLLCAVVASHAQEESSYKLFGRTQIRTSALWPVDSSFDQSRAAAQIRRARLGATAYMLENKLFFFTQIGFDAQEFPNVAAQRMVLLDAYAKWKISENIELKAGQFLLNANRERWMNPHNQQFAEYSILAENFSLQRDVGLELKHTWALGSSFVREIVFLGNGEGASFNGDLGGLHALARLEVFPFGRFENNGDEYMSDLNRESSLKMMIGGGVSYNDNSFYELRRLNDDFVLNPERDIITAFGDVMAKWRSFSFYGQFIQRSVDVPAIYDEDLNLAAYYTTGTAFSGQLAYLFDSNIELAGRYSSVLDSPDLSELASNDLNDYTLAFTKYLNNHRLKLQTDISYRDFASVTRADHLLLRLHLEVGF